MLSSDWAKKRKRIMRETLSEITLIVYIEGENVRQLLQVQRKERMWVGAYRLVREPHSRVDGPDFCGPRVRGKAVCSLTWEIGHMNIANGKSMQ